MDQFNVTISFANGTTLKTWFDKFVIHRDEEDSQKIIGLEYLLTNHLEQLPYLKLEDIVFVFVNETRHVDIGEAVEEEVA